MAKKKKGDRLGYVYSTDDNFEFDHSQEDREELAPEEQSIRIWLDRKGRGGKTVTLITGYEASDDRLIEISKELKKKCGVGGSVTDGDIIIQGDKRKIVQEYFQKMGVKNVKLAGG